METTLEKFGFNADYNTLRCRVCKGAIHKYGIVVLWKDNHELTTTVKYGWCRWWTHGISVCRLMK